MSSNPAPGAPARKQKPCYKKGLPFETTNTINDSTLSKLLKIKKVTARIQPNVIQSMTLGFSGLFTAFNHGIRPQDKTRISLPSSLVTLVFAANGFVLCCPGV